MKRTVFTTALIIALGAPSGAGPAAGADPSWLPRYDWALEVNGKPSADARFFVEREGRRILVQAPQLTRAVLLNPTGQQVTELERSKVTIVGDGEAAAITAGAEASAPTGTYTVDGGLVLFYLGSDRLKISPKAHLEGPATLEQILRHSPLYRKGMDEYSPEAAEVAFLRSYRTPVEIQVFFGTWCPHCKVLVPKFMKSMKEAANPLIKVSYVGVPKRFDTYRPAASKSVKGVPTFIFYRNGIEFGRIPGEPTEGSIEHAVNKILRAQGE